MINIHNVMEEQVISRVDKLYDQVIDDGASWLTCGCDNCRLDTISYVLNRVPPRYVVSGRGVAHNSFGSSANAQLVADIDSIALEGMRLVSVAKRPYHKDSILNAAKEQTLEGFIFNFPTFVGTISDGCTFEPIIDADILLKLDGQPANMMDASWLNPNKTFAATQGRYAFWVAPIEAESDNQSQEFTFTVEATAKGYDPITYSFDVPLLSEKNEGQKINSMYSIKIQELFLFKQEIINEQE